MVAKFWQQAVVVELIHYEFCILQYGTTNCYRFAHQYFRFGTFYHCEVVVDDLRALVVGFCDGSDELLSSAIRRTLYLQRTLSHVLP